MKTLRAALLVVLLLALMLLGVLLGIDNHTAVSLRFLNQETPALPIFWWLYAAFVGGALTGALLCLFGFVRGKLTERQLKNSLARQRRSAGPINEAGSAEAESRA